MLDLEVAISAWDSTFRVKVTPKRVKTTHVRSKINPIFGVKRTLFQE